MSAIDVEELLQPVPGADPCGEDLEYDAAFGELERAALGKPEQQYGDTVIPAEAPDWSAVKRQAEALLGRSKDLRAAVYLARALVRTDGLTGLDDGLALVRGLAERYWEGVHPRLDPEDDNDPTLRVNCITSLRDTEATLRAVREAPLVASPALGRYSLRDVQAAAGLLALPPGAGAPPDPGVVEAAFRGCELGALQKTARVLARCLESVTGIETLVTERVGAAQAPDLGELRELLRSGAKVVDETLATRGVSGVAAADTGSSAEGAPAGASAQPAAAPAAPGQIATREDVVRALDRVCEYFARHEPSSPVPLLLRRAQRLVSKSFLEIVRDLAPDGVAQVETIRGPEEGS